MLSVLPAAAQEQASKFDASYIQVWGQAEKEITPDEFYLSVTINEKDSKGKISIQTQERAMLDALKKLGVDTQKQLRVVDMSSEYFKKGNALAWKQFQLKLNTPEQVAQVFGSLNDLGISNVSMEKVTHSQLDQYKNCLLYTSPSPRDRAEGGQMLLHLRFEQRRRALLRQRLHGPQHEGCGSQRRSRGGGRSSRTGLQDDQAQIQHTGQIRARIIPGTNFPRKRLFSSGPARRLVGPFSNLRSMKKTHPAAFHTGDCSSETTRNDASALTDSHDSA